MRAVCCRGGLGASGSKWAVSDWSHTHCRAKAGQAYEAQGGISKAR